MLKRARLFLNITVEASVSESTFTKLQNFIELIDNENSVQLFYLAEDKVGLKDICIKVTDHDLKKAKQVMDEITTFTGTIL